MMDKSRQEREPISTSRTGTSRTTWLAEARGRGVRELDRYEKYVSLVRTGTPCAEAALMAGFEDENEVRYNKATRLMIEEAARDTIAHELLFKALAVHREVMDNPLVDPKVRLGAAKSILDRGGIPAMAARAPEGEGPLDERALDAMSTEELQERLRALETVLGPRAPVVGPGAPSYVDEAPIVRGEETPTEDEADILAELGL